MKRVDFPAFGGPIIATFTRGGVEVAFVERSRVGCNSGVMHKRSMAEGWKGIDGCGGEAPEQGWYNSITAVQCKLDSSESVVIAVWV